MIKIYKYGEVPNSEVFARDNIASNVEGIVADIIANVRKNITSNPPPKPPPKEEYPNILNTLPFSYALSIVAI